MVGCGGDREAVEKMTLLETVLLVMGSSGFGGLVIGIYNAWVSARKGTVEEWRGLLAEQRELIVEQNKVIEDQKTVIKRQADEIKSRDHMIDDLKDWAERLVKQVRLYAPANVEPEKFVRRSPSL